MQINRLVSVNTIITAFFRSVTGNIAWCNNRACEVGAMTKRHIPSTDRENSYSCICCLDMLKTFQRKNKLFEFLWGTNREEFKVTKNEVTLQWFRCNWFFLCFRCNCFCFSCLLMFTNNDIKNTRFLWCCLNLLRGMRL